jgi:hypothetical protein
MADINEYHTKSMYFTIKRYIFYGYSHHSRYFLRWILYHTHPKIYSNPEVKQDHKPQPELAYGNKLTPWSRVFPQKLKAPLLAKKSPVFYRT